MKLALSLGQESQRAFHGGNVSRGRGWRAGEEQAAGVTVLLARAVRLVGDSRSATARGYNKTMMGYVAIHRRHTCLEVIQYAEDSTPDVRLIG